MSLTSWIFGKRLKPPPPQTTAIKVEKDLKIEMGDGAILLADRYRPASSDEEKLPTVLMRSPYGRAGNLPARLYAERGYQVLIQSTRSTAGSGGDKFVFARHEHADGLAILAWLKRQAWFSGELAMAGSSYLGFTQWSAAAFAGPELRAFVAAGTMCFYTGNYRITGACARPGGTPIC